MEYQARCTSVKKKVGGLLEHIILYPFALVIIFITKTFYLYLVMKCSEGGEKEDLDVITH